MGLIWMMLSGAVLAAQRGGVAVVGSLGVQTAAPDFVSGDPGPLGLQCGGVDVSLLQPDSPDPTGSRSSHSRLVAGLLACRSAEETTDAGVGAGPGGQWGGRSVYTTAHMLGGLGFYEHRLAGRSYGELGFWLRPRAAVGVQLGPMLAVEMGPSAHVIVPVIISQRGAPPAGQFEGILGIDLAVVFGSVAPVPWRQ